MSRIGKQPVPVLAGVKIKIDGTHVTVSGKKGSLERTFHETMKIEETSEQTLIVIPKDDSREQRALHGLCRSLLNNMVIGVAEGFFKKLRIQGVGYRAAMSGNDLELQMGYSHPVVFKQMDGIDYVVEDRGTTIIVSGVDKELVGEMSARIRKVRAPEPYKGKGIRYDGEYVRRKAGKAGKV